MMPVIEFYKELLRGKGSCYHALREEGASERFHNVLLNAATRSTAFDPQCEGTRAPYIYELLLLTQNPKPYLIAAIREFRFSSVLHPRNENSKEDPEDANCAHNPAPTDDDFNFLSELLALFAQDESYDALCALIAEYDALYQHLLQRDARPDLFFPERDAYEQLSITLCEKNLADPIDVIRDVGKILRDNPIYTDYDFDQFHDLVASDHRSKIKTMLNDSAIVAYLKIYYPDFCKAPEDNARSQNEEYTEDLILDIMSEIGRAHV